MQEKACTGLDWNQLGNLLDMAAIGVVKVLAGSEKLNALVAPRASRSSRPGCSRWRRSTCVEITLSMLESPDPSRGAESSPPAIFSPADRLKPPTPEDRSKSNCFYSFLMGLGMLLQGLCGFNNLPPFHTCDGGPGHPPTRPFSFTRMHSPSLQSPSFVSTE